VLLQRKRLCEAGEAVIARKSAGTGHVSMKTL